MKDLTPKEIVEYLDEYIIGQKDAKKAVAVALRNRYRRMRLSKEMQDEIMPKNILMIGSTGVGKTEIARRLSKMLGFPFVKVEASKYTEVGFVGRDVESMVRDLVSEAYTIVKEEQKELNKKSIDDYIIKTITEKLLPPLPKGASEQKQEEYSESFKKMGERVKKGEVDHLKVEITLSKRSPDMNDSNMPPEIVKVQESLGNIFATFNKENLKKEVTVKEAKELLKHEAMEKVLDNESAKQEALKRAEQGGIIFIDEIDKIAVSTGSQNRQDPSKEGVQRDLLPIVEGSTVSTKMGQIRTDHILFIAAGAFHLTKPSDLIPELQGRFPLRVELSSLGEDVLYEILTKTKNSLLYQYEALLAVEGVTLKFDDDAIRALARYSQLANEKTEDIGARRLHTVVERVIEEISFSADEHDGKEIIINKQLVEDRLQDLIEDVDSARYIL